MRDENLLFGFEHWLDLHKMGQVIKTNMVEVPEGDVVIGDKSFHIGKFMVARTLVTEGSWGKVMDEPNLCSRKPVTGVAFKEVSDYLQRLSVPWKAKGRLSIPTEAQLVLALQKGLTRPYLNYSEICLTRFTNPNEMGGHHFFDNLPKEEPFDLVVRRGRERSALGFERSEMRTGFRLVLVDYDQNDDDLIIKYLKEGMK